MRCTVARTAIVLHCMVARTPLVLSFVLAVWRAGKKTGPMRMVFAQHMPSFLRRPAPLLCDIALAIASLSPSPFSPLKSHHNSLLRLPIYVLEPLSCVTPSPHLPCPARPPDPSRSRARLRPGARADGPRRDLRWQIVGAAGRHRVSHNPSPEQGRMTSCG